MNEAANGQTILIADDNPDKEWISGGMWPFGMFPNDAPTAATLDEVVADRPAMLIDRSAHSAWLNTKAMELVGLLDEDFIGGDGFVVERDANGRPAGTIREYTIGHVRKFMAETPLAEWIETGRQMQPGYGSMLHAARASAVPSINSFTARGSTSSDRY